MVKHGKEKCRPFIDFQNANFHLLRGLSLCHTADMGHILRSVGCGA